MQQEQPAKVVEHLLGFLRGVAAAAGQLGQEKKEEEEAERGPAGGGVGAAGITCRGSTRPSSSSTRSTAGRARL